MSILSNILGKIFPKAFGESSPTNTPLASPSAPKIDVEEILLGMEKRGSQKLDWRHSIVDLMKLVGMESDLASRKELAKELNYTGSTTDTAEMNTWLHKQVMLKLEQNGGKIPDEMKH